ncbi:hypothetical protein [Dysgonomonas sp. ZJ279]|nr:hypothetical protein [Dysgonomonas sp. ZJ279]
MASSVAIITDENTSIADTDIISHSEFYNKGLFTTGIQLSHQMFGNSAPGGVQLYGGWERSWIKSGSLYLGLEPRIKIGYTNASVDDYSIGDAIIKEINYNAFSWGALALGRVGYLLRDRTTALFLEGQMGLVNFHSKADIRQTDVAKWHVTQDSYANLYVGGHVGITGKLPTNTRASLWVGISTVNTNMFMDKMGLNESDIVNKKINGELGVAFFF